MTKFVACRPIFSILFASVTSIAITVLPASVHAEALPPAHGITAVPDTSGASNVAIGSGSSTLSRIADFTSHASQLALQAIGMLGIHYKYGGTSPENGLDCSGLVRYVFKEAWGKDLPRTAAEISQVGHHIDLNDLRPGDLVFYNTLKRGFSHVGIYLGDNKFIHSPSAGGQVRIESMDISYWKRRFNGARRIDEPFDGKSDQ